METACCFSDSESFEPGVEQEKDEEKEHIEKMVQPLLQQKDTIHLLSHGKQLELFEEVFTAMVAYKEKLPDQLRKQLRRMLRYLCYLTNGKTPSGKSVFAPRNSARRKGKRSKKRGAKTNGKRSLSKVSEEGQDTNVEDVQPANNNNADQNGGFNNLLEIAKRLHVDVAKITLLGQIYGSLKPSRAVALVNGSAKSLNEKGSTDQIVSNGSENQLLISDSSANHFDANTVAEQLAMSTELPIHKLSGGTIKYLDDHGYNLVLKKSLLVPAMHCGILMGKRGSTLRMIELITSSILTFGHWNDAELWCFVTVVTDNERQQDSAIALLQFLLKYRISLRYDDIAQICHHASLEDSTQENNNKAEMTMQADLENKEKNENGPTSQPENHADTVAKMGDNEKPITIDDKAAEDQSNRDEQDTTRSETISESDTDDDDEHSSDEEGADNEHTAFRLRIPQESECNSEEAIVMNDHMIKLLVNGNGNIGKVIQHFSGTYFNFDGISEEEEDDKKPTLVIKAIDERHIQCAKEFIELLTRYDVRIEKACEPTVEDEGIIVGQGADFEKNIPPSTRKHLIPTNLAWLVPARNFKYEKCSPARMLRICQDGLSMDFGIPLQLQIELRQADSYMEDWNFLSDETIRELCERRCVDSNDQAANDNEQGTSTSDANTYGLPKSKASKKACCPRARQSDEDKKQNLSGFFQAVEEAGARKPLLGKKKEICEFLDIMH
ncbi:hypothetical protein TTRE_0000785301 [Trichuris trichiura]|uniref:KH 1 domain containing protein n=1 Tax=Trichuris trichiura TaxID=36087 RepID=A0A077ZIT5_TRITR|nr:hypothetical protein TTRE_0000785301 [Trichuris trichiura]